MFAMDSHKVYVYFNLLNHFYVYHFFYVAGPLYR